MKNTAIVSALASLVLITACSAPKTAAKQEASVNTSEHCIKENTCFVEVETEGRSSFYTSEEGYDALLTDPIVAQMNVDVKKVDKASYLAMTSSPEAVKFVYNEKSPDQVNVYGNSNKVKLTGLTKVFSIFTNALSSIASVFGIGDIINGWLNGGNMKVQMTYHFGSEVIKKEVEVSRK